MLLDPFALFELKAFKGTDKLSGSGQIFQIWPYLNSLIKTKLPFSKQEQL